MCDPIISLIKQSQTVFDRILLTGHSAGGGVAALLYLRLRLTDAIGTLIKPPLLRWIWMHFLTLPDTPLHCITFGAPPVLAPSDVLRVMPTTCPGQPRSTFLAFAVHGDIVVRADRPYIRKMIEIFGSSGAASSMPTLEFEESELYNVGELVLLFDANPDGDDEQFQAAQLGDEINKLLWGNLKAHPLKEYCKLLSGLK
jgi:hypothetical protein